MDRVYTCDAPFNMQDIARLTEAELNRLKDEIDYSITHDVTRSCSKWTAYEWLRYFMNKASPIEMIEAWNEFNKR